MGNKIDGVFFGQQDVDATGAGDDQGKVAVAGSTGIAVFTAASGITAGDYMVAVLANPMCIRLRIDFNDMPGNLNDLTIDHSAVTYQGETNAQNSGARVGSGVVSDLAVSGNALSVGYTRPSTVTITDAASQIDIAAKTITVTTNTMTGVTDTFHPNSKIRVECQYSLQGVLTYRNLGVYTVSTATIPTATVITVKETIVANSCTAASSNVRITSVSNVFTVGAHDITKTTTIGAGKRVRFIVTSGSHVKEVATTIKSLEYHDSKGFIILNDESSDVLSADVTAGAATLYHDGDGTMENVECSDRGMCQEDGVCKCFGGYTGDDCSVQKAIAS